MLLAYGPFIHHFEPFYIYILPLANYFNHLTTLFELFHHLANHFISFHSIIDSIGQRPEAAIGWAFLKFLVDIEKGICDTNFSVCVCFTLNFLHQKRFSPLPLQKEIGRGAKEERQISEQLNSDISSIFSSLHFQRLKKLYPE